MTPLSSLVSADTFLDIPPLPTRDSHPDPTVSSSHGASPQRPGKQAVQETTLNVVFFITGNPGLIAYYRPFLSLLVEGLEKRDSPRKQVVVAGFSLGGFEVDGDGDGDPRAAKQDSKGENEAEDKEDGGAVEDLPHPQAHPYHENRLYTLRDQIELSYARLENLISRLRRDYDHDPSAAALDLDAVKEQKYEDSVPLSATSSVRLKVILIGHSVGAYIALELVRLRHERHQRAAQPQPKAVPWPWTVSSCILLTPTIIDIHASPSGKLATPLLTSIPLFSALLPTLAHTLLRSVLVPALPLTWLRRLVQRATGMRAGSHGLDATMRFLLSPRGVRQALVMASAEMREIRADTWGDEVWGAGRGDMTEGTEPGTRVMAADGRLGHDRPAPATAPDLYFWFARSDHWVADITRDKILQSRGRVAEDRHETVAGTEEMRVLDKGRGNPSRQENPLIHVDETDGLVHAWCLEQSRLVAARVGVWLEEILDQDD